MPTLSFFLKHAYRLLRSRLNIMNSTAEKTKKTEAYFNTPKIFNWRSHQQPSQIATLRPKRIKTACGNDSNG